MGFESVAIRDAWLVCAYKCHVGGCGITYDFFDLFGFRVAL